MRKRKTRVVWLPSTNANSVDASRTNNYQTFSVDASGIAGDFAVAEIPVVIDGEGQDPLGATATSLADIYDSGYRLRRIVGKIFCAAQQIAESTPRSVIVTAAFIIRKIDPELGLSLVQRTSDGELMSPGQIRNINDPWIWRRSWVLTNALATGASLGAFSSVPTQSNFGARYGSNADGPHVDQKTARTVGAEERLFLNVSSTVIDAGGDAQITLPVRVLTDLRVLGTLRSSVGNRNNASR